MHVGGGASCVSVWGVASTPPTQVDITLAAFFHALLQLVPRFTLKWVSM